jgi:hypothetical protein
MRNALLLLVLGCSLMCPTPFCQSSPADSRTLQAILEEIRNLRQDLQNATVTTRRTEIFLYHMQTQETVVARAFQRVAEAQSKLGEVQSNRNKLLANIKQDEEVLGATQDSNARKELEDVIASYKAKLEASGNEEQEIRARESEFAEQLRLEQAKLNELQGQLDRLDKSLQVSSNQSDDESR